MISGLSASLVQTPPRSFGIPAGGPVAPVKAGAGGNAATPGQLSEEQKAQVAKLRKIDQEVKAHEQAHKNAGGQFAGSASFSYTVGPDGKQYAVAGEVPIDIAPVDGDPAATIAKMTIVVAAALAPAKPSGQDRRVAAQAASLRIEAQAEQSQKSQEKLTVKKDKKSGNQISDALSAIAAYDAGTSAGKTENISGKILNIIG